MIEECYYFDSGWLVRRSPYMKLIFKDSSQRYVKHIYALVSSYSYLFQEYPNVKYEQIDELYYIHQNLSVLDDHLISDFFKLSYRGACWAAFLIAISPNEKYLDLLNSFLKSCHENNRWITNLAISIITQESSEYTRMMAFIREKFNHLKKEKIHLRLNPTKEELRKLRIGEERVRMAYKKEGTDSAIETLKSHGAYRYWLDYNEWRLHQDTE